MPLTRTRIPTDTPDDARARLLSEAIRLNTRLLAVVCGLLAGGLTIAATAASLTLGGQAPGQYLSLLAVFFPGYAVSWTGMWYGFCWAFVLGGLSGGLLYWGYARSNGQRLAERFLDETDSSDPLLKPPIVTLAGHELGTALGLVMGLQLLVTTNWLVIRGTAEDSVHAALLVNYLPGYSVTVLGSLVGAVQLFAITFAAAMLIAMVHNSVARWRHGGKDS